MDAVIVNHNTKEELAACLSSLRECAAGEVIVVDNASTDGSVDLINTSFPWVTLIANTSNCGYGSAANQGIHRSTSDSVLLLNSDTRVAPDTLRLLSTYLEQHPHVAIVGPRLVNPDHSLQASCYAFPQPYVVLLEESGAGRMLRHVPFLRTWYVRTSSHDRERTVPWLLGAALGIRRDSFCAVGGFDEQFHMYYEEVDLCLRLQAAGHSIAFVPATAIEHVGGASTSQRQAAATRRVYRSLAQFYRKHYNQTEYVQLRAVLTAVLLARILRDTVRWWLLPTSRSRIYEYLQVWNLVLTDVRRNWQE